MRKNCFSYINVSQGSVATQLKCGEIFHNHVIADFAQSVPVISERILIIVRHLAKTWTKFGDRFFLTHGVFASLSAVQT